MTKYGRYQICRYRPHGPKRQTLFSAPANYFASDFAGRTTNRQSARGTSVIVTDVTVDHIPSLLPEPFSPQSRALDAGFLFRDRVARNDPIQMEVDTFLTIHKIYR